MAERTQIIEDAIALAAGKAKRFGDRRLGEQNTKASLIEPVLEALGWDIRDPDEVHREFRPKGKDSPVDYALKLIRKPRLILEAKGLGETLADRRWIGQTLGYASVVGVEWCVLTDGDEYRFYNATAPVDADEKMFHRVKLTETPLGECVRSLTLISRTNLEGNILNAIWDAHYVDRRVKTGLLELLRTPSPSVVRILQKHIDKLKPKEIADSLLRLDIRVESPAIVAERDPAKTAHPLPTPSRSASPKAEKKSGSKRTPTTIEGSLASIIAAGHLSAPLSIFSRYMDQEVRAMLLPSGEIEFGGKTFKSCSAAGAAAKAAVTGIGKPTNGWAFWLYRDGTGVERDLAYARALLNNR